MNVAKMASIFKANSAPPHAQITVEKLYDILFATGFKQTCHDEINIADVLELLQIQQTVSFEKFLHVIYIVNRSNF